MKSLPWNEDTVAPETALIKEKLEFLNSKGILTINSQPHVNAAPSSDPLVGWGGSGGYIYQKVCLFFAFSKVQSSGCVLSLPSIDLLYAMPSKLTY